MYYRLNLKQAENNTQDFYYFPTVEINDYNVMIDESKLFDESIRNDIKKDEDIRKIAFGQEDDYTTDCFLGYPFFKETYNLIVIDLRKQ